MKAWVILALLAAVIFGIISLAPRTPPPEPPSGGEEARKEQDQSEYARLISLGYLQGRHPTPAPRAKNVTQYLQESTHEGLNFYVSSHAPEAFLLDMKGNVLHTWRFPIAAEVWPDAPRDPAGSYWRRAHLFENGDILGIFDGIGMVRLDRNSRLLWSYRSEYRPHHDLEVMESGEIYLLTRRVTKLAGIQTPQVLEDFITLLSPDGRAIRHVSLYDLVARSRYAYLLDDERIKSGGFSGDIFHTNTLEIFDGQQRNLSPLFAPGNAMVSLLVPDAICIIDLNAGKILWLSAAGVWEKQHQPTLLENGSILLFDNFYAEDRSRVIEFDLFTEGISWQYDGIDSRTQGSNQRLANGNTLITETERGRVIEITPTGSVVWEFISPHRTGPNGEFIAMIPEMIRLEMQRCSFCN